MAGEAILTRGRALADVSNDLLDLKEVMSPWRVCGEWVKITISRDFPMRPCVAVSLVGREGLPDVR